MNSLGFWKGACGALVVTFSTWSLIGVEGKPKDSIEQLWSFLDRNGDGQVGPYEGAEAWMFLTQEAGGDTDGNCSVKQVEDYLEQIAVYEELERRAMFQEYDEDKDGEIKREDAPDDLLMFFDFIDTDQNDAVTLMEVLNAKFPTDPVAMIEAELSFEFQSLDQNKDGVFTLAELPFLDRIGFAGQFAQLDTNDDKGLSKEEFFGVIGEMDQEASFEIDGSVAKMTGVIGPSTPAKVLELALTSPQVQTISMINVPGSMDDDSMLRAALMVRQLRLSTHLPKGGEVASGGTDFFLAGLERSADKSARFGIHSWAGMGEDGVDLPRDHHEHQKYIDYYRVMGIPDGFYWRTLEAAPADDIHWMKASELAEYQFFTKP
jgi:Ca2+-binding EF-hand superfamily protein